MHYLRSGLKIILTVVAILFIVATLGTYQPVRHILYNNTREVAHTWQEHYGKEIKPGSAEDINGFFETPLMNHIVIGNRSFDPKIRFDGNGEIQQYSFGNGRNSFRLPPDWAANRLLWKEYRYQLNGDGKIYLVEPGKTSATSAIIEKQPSGFPIVLRNRSAESNSQFDTDASGGGQQGR